MASQSSRCFSLNAGHPAQEVPVWLPLRSVSSRFCKCLRACVCCNQRICQCNYSAVPVGSALLMCQPIVSSALAINPASAQGYLCMSSQTICVCSDSMAQVDSALWQDQSSSLSFHTIFDTLYLTNAVLCILHCKYVQPGGRPLLFCRCVHFHHSWQ